MFACNAFGSLRMSCISESHFHILVLRLRKREEYQKCNSISLWSASVGLGDEVCGWSPPARCLTQWHPSWHLQMIDSSAGREFSTGMTGVRGHREGSQGAGTHIGTWKDQQQYLSRAPHFFKAREGLHILTFFPLSRFLFRGFGPVFEKKSPSEVSIHNEETFLLCFPFVVFFLSLKMHKCSTETKKYQNRPS